MCLVGVDKIKLWEDGLIATSRKNPTAHFDAEVATDCLGSEEWALEEIMHELASATKGKKRLDWGANSHYRIHLISTWKFSIASTVPGKRALRAWVCEEDFHSEIVVIIIRRDPVTHNAGL